MKHAPSVIAAIRACVILSVLVCLAGPAAATSDIVISQFYTPGGETGATYKHDYVELFNRGASAIDVTGWSLQYRVTPALEWGPLSNLSGTINPGGYYLIRLPGNAAGNGADLPAADAVGIQGIANTRGSLALIASSNQYFCAPSGPAVDRVAYGANVCPEGTAMAAPGVFAALRADSGCTDTDNNLADFSTGTATPRNSASPALLCAVLDAGDGVATPTLRLRPARPNPSATTTDFTFAIGRDGPVRIVVFDLRGRRLCLLMDGWRPAGEYQISWDGADENGVAAPAGVYFARFEAPRENAHETLRFMRVR